MKQTFLIFIALATASHVNGQIIKSVGIKGGISVANQTWNYKAINFTPDKDSRIGFYSAVSLELLQSKYFNITTDVGYSAKGNTEKILNTTNDLPEGDGSYKTYDTKFNYLSISPMLKARYETARFIPYFLLGFRLDYQLSYKSDFEHKQIQHDFNKTILGANLGAGLEYKIKNIGIFIEGQYQYDFTKVMNTASSTSNSGVEIKNKAMIVCIGLKYFITKSQ